MNVSGASAAATFATYQTAAVTRTQPPQSSTPAQSTQASREVNAGHDGDADDGAAAAAIPSGVVSSPSQAQAAYDANSA